MCLSQEAKIQNTTTTDMSFVDNELRLPSSPWDKLIKQMSKSKLKNTSKINLNKYWSKFGELMASPTKSAKVFPTSNQTPVKKRLDFVENKKPAKTNVSQDNVNDAIKHRYQLVDAEEVDQNIMNEIKELLSYKTADKCQQCLN